MIDTSRKERRNRLGPDGNALVLLIMGQSNAANSGEGNYRSGAGISNFFYPDGHGYETADPKLGAFGPQASA